MAATKFQPIGEVVDLAQLAQTPLDRIPAGQYSLSEYATPLSAAQLADFGAQINPLNITNDTAVEGRTSSLISPKTSPDWFLMLSVGVVAVPDCKVFSINGARVAAPLAASTTVPQFDGTIGATGLINGPGGALDASARYAQLSWGEGTWQAAWAFLNAYRMQMILTGRYLFIDELAAHIGACVSAEEWSGFGSPLIGASEYVRSVNDRQAALNSATTGPRFIPQTMIAGVTPVAAPPPLAQVAHGGPRMDGIFGGWYPTNGLLLYPGLPIQINFVRADNESLYYNRMITNLAQGAEITWDANYSDVLTATAGGVATGFSSSFPFKGGIFKQGILMRGVVLAPKPCIDWYRMAGSIMNPVIAQAIYNGALNGLNQMGATLGMVGGVGDVTDGPSPYVAPGPQGLALTTEPPTAPL